MSKKASKRYFLFLSMTMGFPLLITFIINCLFDPLWYLNGNSISHMNFAFNERLSKMNHFFKNPQIYNCYIFGSSRTTLLNETKIKNHTCFNFSFSGGKIEEFLAFATYLKGQGFTPKLVIVGVDGFNFFSKDDKKEIPEYIKQNEKPPSMLFTYLSIDTLKLSYRTFTGQSPLPRYYKSDFTADILPGTSPYAPNLNKKNTKTDRIYFDNKIIWYQKIASIFSDARVIFYVPPVSVWNIIDYKNSEIIDNYISAIYSIANLGFILYDFSIPSDITRDRNKTYDGSHYDVMTNSLIISTLNGENNEFGIKVNGLSKNEYRSFFLNSINESRMSSKLISH